MNGLKTFNIGLLLQPETNINLGTTYIRMLLDEWGGKWEETLASYNAGKNRVVNWVTWGKYREPAEFVESIPLNETHDYVQGVIRNAAIYRELYGKSR
jgi:soluble lytic murein transglycosylase